MITLPEIWEILVMRMPTEWITLQKIYSIVKAHHTLDEEDYHPSAPNSKNPKWERNVRNVLQYRRKIGDIEWDYNGKYRLTPASGHSDQFKSNWIK